MERGGAEPDKSPLGLTMPGLSRDVSNDATKVEVVWFFPFSADRRNLSWVGPNESIKVTVVQSLIEFVC